MQVAVGVATAYFTGVVIDDPPRHAVKGAVAVDQVLFLNLAEYQKCYPVVSSAGLDRDAMDGQRWM